MSSRKMAARPIEDPPGTRRLAREVGPYAAGLLVCCDAGRGADPAGEPPVFVDPARLAAWERDGFLAPGHPIREVLLAAAEAARDRAAAEAEAWAAETVALEDETDAAALDYAAAMSTLDPEREDE